MSFPFCLGTEPTVLIAAANTTGSVALAPTVYALNGRALRIYNSGTVTVFINFGVAAVTAAVTDYPIGAGVTEVITVPGNTTSHVAAITASGTATIYFKLGDGV